MIGSGRDRKRSWEVLLIGGASGTGKTSVAFRLAHQFAVGITGQGSKGRAGSVGPASWLAGCLRQLSGCGGRPGGDAAPALSPFAENQRACDPVDPVGLHRPSRTGRLWTRGATSIESNV
jgi:hypothetical protein